MPAKQGPRLHSSSARRGRSDGGNISVAMNILRQTNPGPSKNSTKEPILSPIFDT
jgi:hypothetical protein